MRGNSPNYGVAPILSGYNSAGRLLLTSLRTSAGSTLNSHTYQYNGAGQRQRNTLADNTYTTYAYDDDAQLTNSFGYTSGGSPIAAEQLGFGYDAGWNMSGRSVNGTVTSYGVDDRNALSSGGSDPPYSYDGNGNITSKGTGSGTTQYVYDDENRLTRLSYGSSYKTEYAYDGLGRLRVRTEYLYSAGWYVSSTTRYIYDGMRVVQERNSSNTPLVGYTRGKDLSGSLEGAGGIGGLLARSSGYSGGSWPTHHFYHADGNGNVTRLITTALATAASYKYDPYGRTISSSDTIGNVYRFSSKEVNLNSGIYYYGYRFYEPTLQRWLNRDPKSELGFEQSLSAPNSHLPLDHNPFRFVTNDPSNIVDPFGLTALPGPIVVGLFVGWTYGNWCGYSRSGPGAPVDEVDGACKVHDECLARPCDVWKFRHCNDGFCVAVGAANCSKSPNPAGCRRAKRDISIACNLVGSGLASTVGILIGIFR